MIRKLAAHIVDGDLPQNQLVVGVVDHPGSGGASHAYSITGFSSGQNPSFFGIPYIDGALILFQNGPIKEAGLNGITHEALLAILIDRLRSFDSGPFRSRANSIALTKLEEALFWLHSRTRERLARGVEGTLQA